jgi:glycosyltransferase involved in cell wall biosynthesis
MTRPILTVFFQYNPWNPTIGGIQTCINYIIKYLPEPFNFRLVGTATDDSMRLGQWHDVELHGRSFQFMPVIKVENDNVRHLIPTTVKYTKALLGKTFESDFLQFHRLEPSVAALRWSGYKVLYIHNDIHKEIQGNPNGGGILWRYAPWAYFTLESSLVRQFNHIISCNSNSAKLYREHYPDIEDRISYLTNTYDKDLFYPYSPDVEADKREALAHKLNLPATTKFILFAGRLHPQKDPILLIRSIAALDDPNAHLLMVGQGELESEVRQEIDKLNLTKRITILGPMSQAELADLYRVASVFILTSVYEGLARASIEALACGTPVVTTRAGETPNFLTAHSGIVCDERTPERISRALKQVLRSPEAYPAEQCVEVVSPFEASNVIIHKYSELFERWEQLQLAGAVSA